MPVALFIHPCLYRLGKVSLYSCGIDLCPLNRDVRWIEVSAARRSAMYYSNWKFNKYLVKCPLNGWCLLFRLSVSTFQCVELKVSVLFDGCT